MNEEAFFANIARRLGRSQPLREAPARDSAGAPAFWQAYELPEDERIAKFCSELEKLGGAARVYGSLPELHAGLRQVLAELAPQRIGLWGGAALAGFALGPVLADWETVVWDPTDTGALEPGGVTGRKVPSAPVGRDAQDAPNGPVTLRLVETFAAADVGITGCDYAVADTGSVVVLADRHKGRSVSLLPSVHIVLIHSRQICTRMGEVLADIARRNRAGTMPSAVHFISGPSRSSDIENDLTIGVHGPAAVIALVLRECEQEAGA